MPAIKFYKHEPIPMEMHKVKIVQQLNLLPADERLKKMYDAGFNTFQLHNGDIFMDMYGKLYVYLTSQIDEALFFLDEEDPRRAEHARKILKNALEEVETYISGEEK